MSARVLLFFGSSMSEVDVIIPGAVFDKWIYLSSCAKVLLVTLYSYRNQRTGQADLAHKTIIESSGLMKAQVDKGLDELAGYGWIIRERGSRETFRLRIP